MNFELNETIITAVVAIVSFSLVFGGIYYFQSNSPNLQSFHVYSEGKPFDAVKSVMAKNKSLIMQLVVENATSRNNTAIASAAAELVYGATQRGTHVSSYGMIGTVPLNASCNANNSFCGTPDITIKIGDCNCIVVHSNNKSMLVSASADFFLNHSSDLRLIALGALYNGTN